nr:hypothetical protein [Kineosporia babensis]
MAVGADAALILTGPLISRLLVQTGRQPGLSAVYSELLDFAGQEIYMSLQPELTGTTFDEAIGRYDTSSLIGVRTAAGEILVPPPFGRAFEKGDQVIAITEDDDTIVLDGRPVADDSAIIPGTSTRAASPERTLILGMSSRLPVVLRELDAYVAPGSQTHVVGEADPSVVLDDVAGQLQNLEVSAQVGDITDRGVLDSLNVPSFTNVLVLSETEGRTQEMTDARTTVALLNLRDMERHTDSIPTTSEILEIQSRNLARVAEPDDFIVSNMLVSLMVSQVAENPYLVAVFDELFTAQGHELYLKPAADYVEPGEMPFGVVSEAARRRTEIAVGYRLARNAHDQDQAFGVVLNPTKSTAVELGDDDRIIVLSSH